MILALLLSSPVTALAAEPAPIRLHEIQVIGTHNSYHIAPDAVAAGLIRLGSPAQADGLEYTHPPLSEQFNSGIRQIELDLYRDPEGGLYANPICIQTAANQKAEVAPFDPQGMLKKPGTKVLHSPDFDVRTTNYTLLNALAEIRVWSEKHPRHAPLFVLLELKSESFLPLKKPLDWSAADMADLDKEILTALPRDKLLTPDDVRGKFGTLRESIVGGGWPTLDAARGKIVLLFDNEGALRDTYVAREKSLRGLLMFATVAEDHPAAAWFKINDPIKEFDRIQRLVKAGFLIRTRADANTTAARKNDATQRDKAFASGAQLISTDFPAANPRFSTYSVQFAPGVVVRTNPLSRFVDRTVSGSTDKRNATDEDCEKLMK